MTRRGVCIVGAGGGIGLATTRRLAAEGWTDLVLMDRPGAADAIARETGAAAFPLDLADPASIDAAFAAARARLPRIEALVCLAGIVDIGKLATLTLARWNEVLAINLTGTFLCCRAALTWLGDGGRVVLTSSLAGRTGGVLTGTAYTVSKAGIEGLTRSMANEVAPRRITVNCVAPGIVDTPMLEAHPPERRAAMGASTPLGRMGRPEEIAATVAYLVSPDAGYTTGQVLAVNGGLRMD